MVIQEMIFWPLVPARRAPSHQHSLKNRTVNATVSRSIVPHYFPMCRSSFGMIISRKWQYDQTPDTRLGAAAVQGKDDLCVESKGESPDASILTQAGIH